MIINSDKNNDARARRFPLMRDDHRTTAASVKSRRAMMPHESQDSGRQNVSWDTLSGPGAHFPRTHTHMIDIWYPQSDEHRDKDRVLIE